MATKQEWVARVASYMAGTINAGDFEDVTGIKANALSDAELERAEWAMGEVQRRLYLMGKKKSS